MATPFSLEDMRQKVTDLLANPSLSTYARALSTIEEYAELAATSPDPQSPDALVLARSCTVYQAFCDNAIKSLLLESSSRELEMYNRACKAKLSRQNSESSTATTDSTASTGSSTTDASVDATAPLTSPSAPPASPTTANACTGITRKLSSVVFVENKDRRDSSESLAAALETLELEDESEQEREDDEKSVRFPY
ncbi:hypothetical protein F4777DRAFT_596801 [Nemania sp. FL0916]|nr:hypothetical protein F4777DRAFT_596801 [Nemania sp. FL0916]